MVPPSEVVCPHRPGLDCTVVNHLKTRYFKTKKPYNPFHLNCFVDIERKSGSVTEKEDNHNGEQEGSHSGVPPVALGDAVVDQGGPEHRKIS